MLAPQQGIWHVSNLSAALCDPLKVTDSPKKGISYVPQSGCPPAIESQVLEALADLPRPPCLARLDIL